MPRLLLGWLLSVYCIAEHVLVHEKYLKCMYEGRTTSGDVVRCPTVCEYGHCNSHAVTILVPAESSKFSNQPLGIAFRSSKITQIITNMVEDYSTAQSTEIKY